MAYRAFICAIALVGFSLKRCHSSQVSFVLPSSTPEEEPVSYKHAQLWRTPLSCQKDFEMFQKFRVGGDISLWSLNNERADYLVLLKNRKKICRRLDKKKLKRSVLIMNVQRRIDATKFKDIPWTDTSLKIGHRLDFQSYPSINIIDEYLDYLKDNYASISDISTIGCSVQNRTIRMIHISNGNPRNKAIVVLAGQHAREWVAITSALYVANRIITAFDEQSDSIRNMDWYIVPLLNPDGYEYTQTIDRLWRKNRRNNTNIKCPGVDLNRNYPKHWQVYGVTEHDQCEEDYAGPFAMSEPETLAIYKLLSSLKPKVPSAFADFHSYSQVIMHPWGIDGKVSRHKNILESTAKSMKLAILNATSKEYAFGAPSQRLDPASGTAMDWLHSEGVRLSFSFQVRDNGSHGFLLPYDQIEDTGKDTFAAIGTLAEALYSNAVIQRDGMRHTWF